MRKVILFCEKKQCAKIIYSIWPFKPEGSMEEYKCISSSVGKKLGRIKHKLERLNIYRDEWERGGNMDAIGTWYKVDGEAILQWIHIFCSS